MRDSIEKLSEQIRNQPHLDETEKAELLAQLAEIEAEVRSPETPEDTSEVEAIVRRAADEAEGQSFSDQIEEGLLRLEASFPTTAAALGRVAHVLSRMGI